MWQRIMLLERKKHCYFQRMELLRWKKYCGAHSAILLTSEKCACILSVKKLSVHCPQSSLPLQICPTTHIGGPNWSFPLLWRIPLSFTTPQSYQLGGDPIVTCYCVLTRRIHYSQTYLHFLERGSIEEHQSIFASRCSSLKCEIYTSPLQEV